MSHLCIWEMRSQGRENYYQLTRAYHMIAIFWGMVQKHNHNHKVTVKNQTNWMHLRKKLLFSLMVK